MNSEVERRGGTIIHGLDLIDVIKIVDTKKRKFIALTLGEIEQLGLEEEQYKLLRKFVLDGFNEYTRSLLRALLGDIETQVFSGKSNL